MHGEPAIAGRRQIRGSAWEKDDDSCGSWSWLDASNLAIGAGSVLGTSHN